MKLANTLAIRRKSYVNEAVVTAFEDGVLERFAETLKSCRSPARKGAVPGPRPLRRGLRFTPPTRGGERRALVC